MPQLPGGVPECLSTLFIGRAMTKRLVIVFSPLDLLQMEATLVIMQRRDRNDRGIAVVSRRPGCCPRRSLLLSRCISPPRPKFRDAQPKLGAVAACRRLDEVLDVLAHRSAAGGRLVDLLPKDRLADDGELAMTSRRDAGDGRSPS
jgi:hypothetical protein